MTALDHLGGRDVDPGRYSSTMTQPRDELLVIETDSSTVIASGEIDAHTAPALAAAIDAALPTPRVDLSRIRFLDSSGLRVLIEAHQRCLDAGSTLTIVAPSEPVRRLFEISEVDDYLIVVDPV